MVQCSLPLWMIDRGVIRPLLEFAGKTGVFQPRRLEGKNVYSNFVWIKERAFLVHNNDEEVPA